MVQDEGGPGAPGRVVVGVDGSEQARAALVWALRFAARRGAPVEVVACFPVDVYWSDAYLLDTRRLDAARAAAELGTHAFVAEVRSDPAVRGSGSPVEVTVVIGAGAPAEHLVDRSADAELLVVGSRGHGAVAGALLGSVSLRCVTHARCPVVVVHDDAAPATAETPTVVVGADGSPTARAALAAAAEQAALLGARLEVVTAYRPADTWSDVGPLVSPEVEEIRAAAQCMVSGEVADVLGDADGVSVDALALEGAPADVLVQRATGAALLVVGTRGRGTLPGLLLGSVALRSVVHARCPVMVVHPNLTSSTDGALPLSSASAAS